MRRLPRSGQAGALCLFMISIILGSSASIRPQTFPFTAEENADGARFVWYVYNQTGFPFEYAPAKALPASKNFRPAPKNKPRVGDVAWWKDYVAIYAGHEAPRDSNVRTAEGSVGLRELEKRYGPVKWFRYRENDRPPVSGGPGSLVPERDDRVHVSGLLGREDAEEEPDPGRDG